jgi:hypothetical protein
MTRKRSGTAMKDEPRLMPNATTTKQRAGKVHPVIIFPYTFPNPEKDRGVGLENLKALYSFLSTLLGDPRFARPITVMNRQTFYTNTRWVYDDRLHDSFENIISKEVEAHSTIVHTWAVDTCQMWLAGFGKAYDEDNPADDVYWLIPGDFNYAKDRHEEQKNRMVFRMRQLPEAVLDHDQDLAIGEITVDINSAKQLIDTYGTYGLLYNWFPHEAQAIRRITDKPRSEFLAISHGFLREVLRQRWYAYEQTIIILLQATIGKKRVHPIKLGDLSDLPQGREKLSAAMQQVERTERALKLFWRERNESQSDWADRFKRLDAQSGQIRGAALVILENLLVYP